MPGDGLLRREREGSVHITLPTRIEFSEVDHGFEPSERKLVRDLTRQTIFWQEISLAPIRAPIRRLLASAWSVPAAYRDAFADSRSDQKHVESNELLVPQGAVDRVNGHGTSSNQTDRRNPGGESVRRY
jgi:hypothetical protein